MQWLRDQIGTPQTQHNVKTPDAYRAAAKEAMARLGVRPRIVKKGERPAAFVSDGRWVVLCPCGNGCIASREWGLAVCYECGAEYEPVFPDDADDAEAVLLARTGATDRHYFPDAKLARRHGLARAETAADLVEENRARGLKDRAGKLKDREDRDGVD